MNEVGESVRKVRSNKKIRVNPSLSQGTHQKLEKLALACGLTKTTMAEQIITAALNSAEFINVLQDRFEASEYRVYPMIINGKLLL